MTPIRYVMNHFENVIIKYFWLGVKTESTMCVAHTPTPKLFSLFFSAPAAILSAQILRSFLRFFVCRVPIFNRSMQVKYLCFHY